MRYLFLILSMLVLQPVWAQDSIPPMTRKLDSLPAGKMKSKPPGSPNREAPRVTIKDYKIISFARDTTVLDTSLTIDKEYRYNYLRKDNFELMPFSNIGQPYNQLGVNLNKKQPFPRIGARARHFNYMEVEDIDYYNVATPTTELFFKTTLEQGQLLDGTLTSNFNRRFNISIAYKGFRSRGKYREDETTSGNFRTTANYATRNGSYRFRAHVTTQDIRGQENGGLLNSEEQFESGNSDFTDRSRVDIRFSDAQNAVNGKRYYLDHSLRLLGKGRDSVLTTPGLYLNHAFAYETKWYQYSQNDNNTEYFGSLLYTPVKDQSFLKTTHNRMGLLLRNKIVGELEAYARHFDYSYFFRSILITEDQVIPSELSGQEILGGARWNKSFGKFYLESEGSLGLSGNLTASILDARLGFPIGKGFEIETGIHHSARKPNFNFLLYQSSYANYNWDNSNTFENERVQSLFFHLRSDFLGSIEAQFSTVDNYSYFASTADADQIEAGEERSFIRPFQSAEAITQLRLKYLKEFRWKKWALNNTLLFQQVDQPASILNVPALTTRNTLYYSSQVFKKAMFVQTGVTLKYFTTYNMNGYNPILAEFYTQDREEFGGFPMLDFFINARVRQTRIYFKFEHFNSLFSNNDFFAAPDYPYRDFVIRFGLVWNFFS
jgi:hypothetical protein